MTRRLGALLATACTLVPVTDAAAHGGHGGHGRLSAAQLHRAADLADVPVARLERRVRAMSRRLGYRPGTRRGRTLRTAGDPGTVGRWSGVLPAPVLPIFEALLPNGEVLM